MAFRPAGLSAFCGFGDPAHQDRVSRLPVLPGDLEAEVVEVAQRREISSSERSHRHVASAWVVSERRLLEGKPICGDVPGRAGSG